jgi:hypothetical protein
MHIPQCVNYWEMVWYGSGREDCCQRQIRRGEEWKKGEAGRRGRVAPHCRKASVRRSYHDKFVSIADRLDKGNPIP